MRRHLRCAVIAFTVAGVAGTLAAQSVGPAQSAGPSPSAPASAVDDLLREGFELSDLNQDVAARDRFDRALTLARDEKNLQAEAEAHRGVGLIHNKRADYPAARAELEQALTFFERASDRFGAARVKHHLGAIAQLTGDWIQSRELLNEALAEFEDLGQPGNQARVLVTMSTDANLDPAEKLKLLGRAQEIAAGLDDTGLQGILLRSLGDYDFATGDFSAAMAKLESAIALLEKVPAKGDLARALTSLGRLDRAHGHPERAQELYRRALALQEEIGDGQGAIQSINAIAVAFQSLSKPREAVREYDRALALARQTGSARIINFQLGNLAAAYGDVGDHARAAELLTDVLRQPIDNWLAAYRYKQLSNAYTGLGRYRDALEAADKAIDLTRTVGPADELAERLDIRARVRKKLGDTVAALADEREALETIEHLRARVVPTDFMKRGFSKQSQQIFAFTVELLQTLGQDAQALETAEQARARAFLDLLATRGLTDAPASAPGSNPTAAAATPSLTARLDTLSLRGDAGTSPGAASDLKSPGAAPAIHVDEITAVARELQSTLLIYYVTPQATFIWVVQPSSAIRLTRVDVSAAQLTELIRRTRPEGRLASRGEAPEGVDREALATRGGDVFFFGNTQKAAWRALYQLLIRRVRDQLPAAPGNRIAIVPHGPLFLLSFAALQDEAGRYLLEKYTLHYAPAAALLRFTHEQRQQRASVPRRYLLVADPARMPARPDGQPLAPLPGTRREVTTIARLLAGSPVTVLTGPQAGISDVRAGMRDATIIHLATHGIVRDDEPLDSFLALGRAAPAAEDDGRLTAGKIYRLDLRADVVVLSACRTALGEITGDGIAGLTRAFFYAGASSVVATMWDVADEPTVQLMPEFYRLLVRGRDKARSLRGSQLKLLADLRAGRITIRSAMGETPIPEDPFFWAGFVLVGEP
jgi:CHAT domain-containing protein/tetratricopeptide (TPR) repeat protein